MSTKPFKTLDEQVELLKSRGLKISNIEAAKSILLRNNYYRLSGYSLTLRSHDQFYNNVFFENIVDIYQFDQTLRHILLEFLEVIEITVKSVYAYEFTKRYGPLGYLDHNNFSDDDKHAEIVEKAKQQMNARLPHEAYLKHYYELEEDIPLWAYVDLLTISDISFLIKISDSQLQEIVALDIGLNKRGSDLLPRFMHSMTILRNLCAHGSRLFNRLFEQKPWLSKSELSVLITNKDGTKDNAHLFSYILIMRRMLSQQDFNDMKNQILNLIKKHPFVNMLHYGFPENWSTQL